MHPTLGECITAYPTIPKGAHYSPVDNTVHMGAAAVAAQQNEALAVCHTIPCCQLTTVFPQWSRNGNTFSRLPAKRATMALSAMWMVLCPKHRTHTLGSIPKPINRHWRTGCTLYGYCLLCAKWLSAPHPVSLIACYPTYPIIHPCILTVGKLTMSLKPTSTCPNTGTHQHIGQSGLTNTLNIVCRV